MLGTFWKSLRTRSIQRVVHENPINLEPYPPTTVSLFTKPPRPFRSAITTRMHPPLSNSPDDLKLRLIKCAVRTAALVKRAPPAKTQPETDKWGMKGSRVCPCPGLTNWQSRLPPAWWRCFRLDQVGHSPGD